MKKILFAAIIGLALCAAPSVTFAGPPGFYGGGTWVSPFPASPFALGPTTTGFNYYASPYGYQQSNSYSVTPTIWGWDTSYSSTTAIRPLAGGPTHSVYWDPFNNTYQYMYGVGNFNSTAPRYSYRVR